MVKRGAEYSVAVVTVITTRSMVSVPGHTPGAYLRLMAVGLAGASDWLILVTRCDSGTAASTAMADGFRLH